MIANHHLLAKTATDSILANFKSGTWKCCTNIGAGFYRVASDSTFPSPDAAFYEDSKEIMVSFEFKPPTETKRGILTGLGQSIAYLDSCNLSYLIIPQKLEDYDIGSYMLNIFRSQIEDKLPVGLIIYENSTPNNVNLVHNINTLSKKHTFKAINNGRFWAKHQDLPIALFHLILHCYYLKKTHEITDDAFAYCWNKFLVPGIAIEELNIPPIKDTSGDEILTLSGRKNIAFFEKRIATINTLSGSAKNQAIMELKKDADSSFTGDNYYNAIRKNFVSFLKHIGTIDSTGNLTEDGFKLYHLGLINGPRSKMFVDYFTQRVLINGHHLDIIFDLDNLINLNNGSKSMTEIKEDMQTDYEARGMLKRNPQRVAGSKNSVEFLKYEFILWNSLNLIVPSSGTPDKSFNWKRITEVCSMPDL